MIIATHGIVASQLAGFDADAQAFFDRVTTAGGTLSATEKTAVNQLVLDLKSYSIWSKMKAIYPMVGASSAACAQNLKSSSFTGTFSSGWTFASTGVTPNGTSAYMDTTLLSNDFTDNKGGYSCYTRTAENSTSLRIEYGSYSSNWVISWLNVVGFGVNGAGYGQFTSITNTFKGLLINQRLDNSNIKINYNGGNETKSDSITSINANARIYVGAWGNNSNGLYYGIREISLFAKHDYIDNTESNNFINAVQTFQTTLSRNV